MSATLVAAGVLLGVAGVPHCAAMCAAPCAAVARRCGGDRPRQAMLAQQIGRVISYAAAGALAAASAGGLVELARSTAWLRPLWLALPLTVLALGLWLLVLGRPMRWTLTAGAVPGVALVKPPRRGHIARWVGAGTAGLFWAAWPCGLLYSALLVAALANGPWGGAAVMAGFALASLPGVLAGPVLWRVLGRRDRTPSMALRGAGALLVAASAWGLWLQFQAPGGLWCAPA